MAGIDLPRGKNRDLNRDVNMIPFIDLLMVTVMFLLISAVWVTHSRMDATAQVPGDDKGPIAPEAPVLHLYAGEGDFTLAWKQGATTLSERRVARGAGERHDELAAAVAEEWRAQGGHRDPADRAADRCVLHTPNAMPFREIVAVLDAVYDAKRDVVADGEKRTISVFQAAFAMR